MPPTQAIYLLALPSAGRKFMFILDHMDAADEFVSVILENTGTTPERLAMSFGISESFEAMIVADEGLAENFLHPSSPTEVAHIVFQPGVCYNMSRKTARHLWEVLVAVGFVRA